MALYVNTNVSSINAQRKLANSTLALNTSYQRLSSGLRINSSKDDAAGLQISDRLTAQINGLNQGNRNSNDGIALCQTIEGALDETTNMLQRIRTLAVQAANGTNTQKDRQALQEEVTSLSNEINRIARKTTFAGAQVLDGGKGVTNGLMRPAGGKTAANATSWEYFFQVGANAKDEITLECGGFTMSAICSAAGIHDMKAMSDGQNITKTALTKAGLMKVGNDLVWMVNSPAIAQKTLKFIDSFIELVDSKRAALGAIQNHSCDILAA